MRPHPNDRARSLERFRGVIATTLGGASLLYAGLAAVYLVAPPLHPGEPYALTSVATALVLLALSMLTRRVDAARVPDLALAGGLCAEGHALAFLVLARDPAQTVVLVIIMLATGFLIPFPVHTTILLVAGLLGWIGAIAIAPTEFLPGHFAHWSVNLISTAFLALFFCIQRWLSLRESDRAEAALHESEARFRGMAESTPLAVFLLSPTGERVYENAPFQRLVGETSSSFPRPLVDILHPEDRDRVVRLWADTMRTSASFETTHRIVRDAGEVRWLSVKAAPVRDHERLFGFVVISEDVTERIRTEEALRRQAEELETSRGLLQHQADELAAARDVALAATRAKSDFLARMSHEIRTPMNVIFGMTEMIGEAGALSPEQAEHLGRVRRAASGLLDLMNDVLDLSRIEAGKTTLAMSDVDVAEILLEVAELLAPQAFEKRIELVCRIPPGFPSLLRADPLRLRQIVINLASNAVKFTEHGSVSLDLELLDETTTTVRFRLGVTDTGIGIAPAKRDAIFESFSQAEPEIAQRYGGTGLGLAICRQLVELMGGRIELRSEIGVGSTFAAELSLTKQAVSQPRVQRALLKGFRVRIVEPVAITAGWLAHLLEAWGCEIAPDTPPPTNGAAAEPGDGAVLLLTPIRPSATPATAHAGGTAPDETRAIVRLLRRTNVPPPPLDPALAAVPVEVVWKPVRPAALLHAIEAAAQRADGVTQIENSTGA